jgi:hypothetical protein
MDKMIVPFEVKEVDENGDFYEFSGYASTFKNVDRGGDVVMPGAFDDTIKQYQGSEKMPILWQHNHDMPLGVFVEMRADSKGLFVRGQMPKDDDFVKGRVMPQMRVGSIRKMSIGYSTEDFAWDGNIRQLKKIKLWETSLVTIPMNASADVTGFKSVIAVQDLPVADRATEWDAEAALARVRDWADAKAEPNDRYRTAFMWHDKDNADDFEAYKLPCADVIDGKLTIIPRAVFAAAASIAGAKHVEISEGDRAEVAKNVEKYYEKMGLESPFEAKSCFRVDSLDGLTERELEKLLKKGVRFPGECARALVSAHKSLMRDADKVKRDANKEPSTDYLIQRIKGLGTNGRK